MLVFCQEFFDGLKPLKKYAPKRSRVGLTIN